MDNPWRHSDGRELNGGYPDLAEILEDGDDPEIMLVSGVVHRDGPATLGPCMVLENGTVDIEAGEAGEYYLVLIDSQDTVLSRAGFDVGFHLMRPEARVELDKASFVYRIAWLEGTERIELQGENGEVLATREVSLSKPQVQVLHPNGGEAFAKNDMIRIGWEASDRDSDPLTFSLAISADDAQTWLPLDIDITGTEYELDARGLEEGQNYIIRVRATDGVNTEEDVSDGTFTIAEEDEAEEGGIGLWAIIAIAVGATALAAAAVYVMRRPKKA